MIEYKLITGIELNLVDISGKNDWPWDTFAVVAVEDGKVVGQSAILNLPCIEGTTVVEEKRGGSLAFRLIQKVEELYKSLDKPSAVAMVSETTPEVATYMERIGYKRVPVTVYVKELN